MNRVARIRVAIARVTVVFCMLALGLAANGQDGSERFKAYMENWERAQQAFAEQDFREALKCYERVRELMPYEPSNYFQIACCQAMLDERDQAMQALQKAVQFGWDSPDRLSASASLATLRDHAGWDPLIAAAETCRDEAQAYYAGKHVVAEQPAPLLILLHGLGAGPRSELPYWQQVADELGMVIIAPRGGTKVGSMFYGWHRDGDRNSQQGDYFDVAGALQRIDAAIAVAQDHFSIDASRIVLVGFSQGGGVAVHALKQNPQRFRGVIAFGGLHQDADERSWQAIAAAHPIKIWLSVGALDKLQPRSRQLAERLRAAGVVCHYAELDNLGHEYPLDLPTQAASALRFVLDDD